MKRIWKVVLLSLLALLPTATLADSSSAEADEAEASSGSSQGESSTQAEAEDSELFERVRVTGRADQRIRIPGSVSYLDEAMLQQHAHTDIHRVLALVPGINVQEEDGFGLRPNIGMRGTGVERSSKITLLEDGVLIAPAPYSAPSAYYFPTAGRMEGIEVRKGSASIQNGPFTNGGVLNLLSSRIPDSFGGDVQLFAGSHDTVRGRLRIGDSSERFGWLFETFQTDTAGFKELDGGGDTGFDLQDYLVKLRFTSSDDAAVFQAFELKLGKTEQFGDETYLGLTQADFDANPLRRYAGSQLDNIDTDHEQLVGRYMIRPNDRFDVTLTAYNNDFFRNWRKLQSVNGASLSSVLDDPSGFAAELDILRADLAADSADDALRLRNNRRDYYNRGLDVRAGYSIQGTSTSHEIEFGLRYHEDQEDRFQEEDGFRMTAAGQMVLTSTGAPGSQANRVSSAEALSGFVRDTITTGRWTITPGVRFESIDFERLDYADAGRTMLSRDPRLSTVDELIPGVGVSYELSGQNVLFAGVHRGFAPPGPGADDATEVEESVNYELGYRYAAGDIRAELVGFHNDYDNLIGVCTVSSGTNCDDGDVFNAGEVEVVGIEASLQADLGLRRGLSFGVPVSLVYTFTDTEFQTSFDSGFWGDVVVGDELPYLPQHQASLGAGLVFDRFSTNLSLNFVDQTRTVAGQGAIQQAESTDSHLVVDLATKYKLRSALALELQVRNLFDREYAVARRPAGVRPGLDRTVLLGVTFGF